MQLEVKKSIKLPLAQRRLIGRCNNNDVIISSVGNFGGLAKQPLQHFSGLWGKPGG